MRTGGVSLASLLLLASLVIQVSQAGDIYWEGEEEESNEFLEVKHDDVGLGGHLRRLKRGFFDFWSPASTTEGPVPENYESVTEDDDTIPDGKDEDLDIEGSGLPESRVEPEPREKTLRVTFVVMEPYQSEYSNRDSMQFQNFSRALADDVNVLFDSLPGTQRASLVRIQSRLSDEFSCKVTLDIVTTGYEDTDRIMQTLRDHISYRGTLGTVAVSDTDFSANVIDPGSTLDTCSANEIQCDDGNCVIESARCNGVPDCSDGSDEAGCPANEAWGKQDQTNYNETPPNNSGDNDSEVGDNEEDQDENDPWPSVTSEDPGPTCADPIPCSSSSVSYCPAQRCDDNEDCPLGDDEQNCNAPAETPDVERGDQTFETETPDTLEESATTRTTVSPPDNFLCSEGDIRCDETRCISPSQRCDRISDCYDGTDELGCSESCGADDFRCNNGKCIEGTRRCDRVVDCPGEEDEQNCECRDDEFRCESDGSCIESRKRCDGDSNCKDNSDEQNCACSSEQWQCDHGSCIKRSKRCDGRVDCPTDRSDERNCFATGYFKCRTGKVIADSLRCNRRYDCPEGDYSDEQNCPCGEDDFKCDNGHCIPASKHCDRTHDCQDGSDEKHCTYGTVCMAYQFKCSSGKCVKSESWCNGTAECDDGSDEMNCPCKRGQFQCRDGSCINIALRCNGRKDCRPSGEDEFNCGSCRSDHWQCNDGGCVSLKKRCDGRPDCRDHSDERKCEPIFLQKAAPLCPPESFTCDPSSSIPCAKRCDGRTECDGGEDEDNCQDCNHECDGKCLDDRLICDSKPDCSDGSDELHCATCDGPDDFRCDDGECLNAAQQCNGIPECADNTDELNCNHTMIPAPGGCRDDQFVCRRDKTCIDMQFFCDGHPDCTDNTDEENCPWYMTRASRSPAVVIPCRYSEFTCYNGRCIPYTRRCDNIYDCSDFSDEQNCDHSACDSDSWQCRTGQCIPSAAYCDGNVDCSDNSDEISCPVTTPWYPAEYPNRAPTTPSPVYTTTQRNLYDPYRPDGYPSYGQGNRPYGAGSPGPDPYRPGSDPYSSGSSQRPDSYRPGSDPYSSGSSQRPDTYRPGSDPYGSGGSQRPDPYRPGSDPYSSGGSPRPGSYRPGSDPYGTGSSPRPDVYRPGSDPYGSSGSPRPDSSRPDNDPYGSEGSPRPGSDPYGSGGSQRPDPYRPGSDPYGTGSSPRPDVYRPGSDPYGSSGSPRPDSSRPGNDPYGSEGSPRPGSDPYASEGSPRPDPYRPESDPYGSGSGSPRPDLNGEDNDIYGSGASSRPDNYPYGSEQSGGQTRPGSESYGPGGGQTGSGSDSYGSGGYQNRPGGDIYGSGRGQTGTEIDSEGSSAGETRPGGYPYGSGRGQILLTSDTYAPSGGQTRPGSYPYGSGSGQGRPGRPNGACKRNQWRCENGPCIDSFKRCNGKVDCPFDFSDELDCPTGSPVALSVKTYPNEQTVRYGGDVVFQCRDEGPQRAPVRWIREGGRPLKPGSSDRNGRLELFQVTVSDGGVYVCQTPNYLGYPGSEVKVTLNVDTAPVTQKPPFPSCQAYEATCGNGQCIPKSAVCDGKVDCADQSDEETCHHNGMCEPNEFQCSNRKCVLKTWLCDSENDCGDGSDERNCGQPSPGHPCLTVEFACASQGQCVPKSFHCDGQSDCMDGSDEIGCAPVHVTKPPKPSNVRLNPGDTLTLVCEAVGIPVPLISWRLNWGHVPPKCSSTSVGGVGTLTCPNIQPEDSGAYSCEAINNRGTTFAAPDSIVHVNKTDPCPPGYFNNDARSQSECIRCFCFGESTQCRSADLFTYNMPTPLGEGGTRLVGVTQSPTGEVRADSPISNQYFYQPLRNGATVTKVVAQDSSWSWGGAHPYLTLPETYNGNQLTSYGGHLKYTVSPHTAVYGSDDNTPTIIIKGKYGNLFHYYRGDTSRETNIEARLTPENWQKPSARGLVPASREDIMMALDNIELILLRADLNNAGVNITDFAMESAQHINVGLGAASLVEECTCPPGYEGLSCERCATGFVREKSGPWLGNCVRETCPPGTYGDPASGYACKPCPCPLTNRENQFATTCALTSDGSVACDCNPGYEGKNCQYCASGYEGNPLVFGDSCKPKPTDNCNPTGTSQVRLPDECVCKDNVQGRYCDHCKNDSFYLSEDFRHGCALCFCSGVSQQCRSSNLRRKTTTVQFNVPQIVNQVKIYNSAPSGSTGSVRYSAPIETDLKPQLVRGEISLAGIERSKPSVYYWSLPSSFTGDKVTSYGGYLRYTLQNVPSYDWRSKNNASDIQLISENHLTFHYSGNFTSSYDGTLSASVQFLEKGWQRYDGKEISREHFLLALADVKTILIKARYSDNAELATPITVSIDTAEPNGDGPTALHVEQCVCPPGYIGSSCEDCAPGYTRSSSGLYLEHCDRCECNGRTNMCNPETGVCYECSDNTAGDHCEICKPGYERDSYGNCVESASSTIQPCRCDPRGTASPCDASGVCDCKRNVEGNNCDRCRPGTFGLDSANPLGCLACYCSGVTKECHEGNHYTRIPMAAPILGDNYGGYAIMDLNAQQVINDQFVPVPDKSELMYIFSFVPTEELFWSLPVFPGNRVLSYGGTLSLRQEFGSNDYNAISEPGTDVVLVGDDTSIYWSNPTPLRAGESLSYQVPLREDGWLILNTATPASRTIFMSVLKNLRRVLVRATVVPNILSTTIADVSMDTATENYEADSPAAKGVEICMCPSGYTGTSCESCTPGFYKDQNGYCKQCTCNGHDCQLDSYGQVVCNCRPPYTGYDCSTIGLVMELHPTIHDDGVNSTFFRRVTLTCKYRAPEPLNIKFYHEGHELWPPKYYNESRLHMDGWHGEHVLHTVWDTRRQGEIYECHTVTEKGFTLGVLTTSLPEPAGEPSVVPSSSRPPPPEATVIVKITSPTIKIEAVGSSVNFTCQAQSRMTRNRLRISWSKADGYLPQGRTMVDETAGLLLITNLQISDSGQYICETSDGVSTAQAIATLKVPGNEMSLPSVTIKPTINEYYEGDRIELECEATGNPEPTITWQRASNRPLPASAEHFDELFIIDSARVEDSGEYRCIASNTVGSDDRTAVITVRPRPSWPSRDKLTVSPTSSNVNEGQSTRVVCTGTTNVPAGSIDWIRQDGSPLLANVRSDNGVLYIDYARPENQGVYVCLSTSSEISPVPVLVTIIPQGTQSPSEMSNITVSVDRIKIPTGGSGTVDCEPQGYPAPLIKWTKHGSSFGPGTSQRGNTLIISNAQDSDEGYYLCEGNVNGTPVANIYVFVEIEKRDQPRVEIYPQGEQAVTLGSQYEVHCRVLGGYPEPDVMWSRSGGRPLSQYAQIQPHNILRFEKIDVNDEGEYTCTATNVAGTASASAVLKVRSPPEITITPSNFLQVVHGDAVTVECRANGYPEPMVSIKSNTDLREIVSSAPGIAVLRISSASERDDGDYICTATSPAGTIAEQIGIRVDRGDGGFTDFGSSGEGEINPGEYPSKPNETPSNLLAYEGQPELTIYCNGSDGFEVRWDRADGQPLQRNAVERESSLIIYNVSKSDSGQYVCSLYNRYTSDVVKAAYTSLLVFSAPRITLRPPTQTVHPGQSPTVQCVVEGDEIIDISWKPYNRAPSSRVEIRGSTLIFHQIEVEDAGQYECFARNRYANASAIAEVVVSEETDRVPSESHDNEQYAHSGAAVHLSCNVTQPNVRIQWTKDGRPVSRSRQKSDGSLFIKLAQKSDSGRYICLVQDQYGRRTSNYINLHIEGIECSDTEFRCYDYSGCIDEALLCDDFQDCKDNSDEENCLFREKRYSDSLWDYMDQFIPVTGARDVGAASLVAIEQPRRQFRVTENVEVICRVRSQGTNVKWERYGTNQYVESRAYGDGAILIIHGVQESDAGVYRCTGTDPYGGSFYEDFNLEVEPGSSRPAYPDDRNVPISEYTARLRDSVDLPCKHDMEQPVFIEWRREFFQLGPDVRANQPNLHLESVTEADAGTYVCRVSNSRATTEARAILRVEGVVPMFNGESWLSLPTLKDAYRQFDVEISFRPTDYNGLILYNSQNQGRSGDYLALQLEDGIPQFVLDTGSGPVIVKGDRPLQLSVWHTIRISRTNSRVTMDVDNFGPFIAESTEQWAVLDLTQPMYIGGVPDYDQLPSQLAGASGFVGCVSMLILGREEKNIMLDSLEQFHVNECDSCSPNLCLNNGVCQEARNEHGYMCICPAGFAGQNCNRTGEACRPGLCGGGKCADTVDGYKCACPVTLTGRNCEIKQSIEYPAFTGSAYLAIKPPTTSRFFRMSMKIKATSPVTDGIIMYCAESSRGYGGFTSLAVHNRKLEFRYDLGGGSTPVVLISNWTLPANEWTDVHIARIGAVASLKINQVHNFEQKLDSPTGTLRLETPMFVGGVDDSIVLNNNTGVTGGFSGCIKDVMTYGNVVDIVNSSIQSANVQECSNYDRGDIPEMDGVCPCRNGGTCPSDSTTCICQPGFTGPYCESRVASPLLSSRQPPSDPCSLRPCRNGGTCRPDLTSRINHTCDCPLGYAGASCQMSLQLFQSVGFNGNGYVELPAQQLRYERLDAEPAVIALAFHTTSDGVLLYQRETLPAPNYGDYILLRVERGFVVLDWDFGSGLSTLVMDNVYVNDGERHEIIAKLSEDNIVSLSVDRNLKTGTTTGLLNLMNADSNIYIGGIPDSINVQRYPGLVGCVEQVELMDTGRSLNLGQIAVAGRNTQRCKEASRS